MVAKLRWKRGAVGSLDATLICLNGSGRGWSCWQHAFSVCLVADLLSHTCPRACVKESPDLHWTLSCLGFFWISYEASFKGTFSFCYLSHRIVIQALSVHWCTMVSSCHGRLCKTQQNLSKLWQPHSQHVFRMIPVVSWLSGYVSCASRFVTFRKSQMNLARKSERMSFINVYPF